MDDEVGGTCNVCGGALRYGGRHRKCGEAVMAAKARCLKEWETVNDPPCHPGDDGWVPCILCSGELSGGADSGGRSRRGADVVGVAEVFHSGPLPELSTASVSRVCRSTPAPPDNSEATTGGAMTFDEWWDTTRAAATPETFAGWERSCRQAWDAGAAREREQMIADGWRKTKYVAPVTECEACFTPDACAIRGQCGHYLREGGSTLAEAGANATMMAAAWRLYWEAKLYVQTVDPSGQWAQLQGLREAIAAAELRA